MLDVTRSRSESSRRLTDPGEFLLPATHEIVAQDGELLRGPQVPDDALTFADCCEEEAALTEFARHLHTTITERFHALQARKSVLAAAEITA
jgi:hypothetical protein